MARRTRHVYAIRHTGTGPPPGIPGTQKRHAYRLARLHAGTRNKPTDIWQSVAGTGAWKFVETVRADTPVQMEVD